MSWAAIAPKHGDADRRDREDKISRLRIIELVELEALVKGRKIPFQAVDEDLFAGREHGAQRRVAGRSGRPRGLIGHETSFVAGSSSQTTNPAGRLFPFMGKSFATGPPD